MPARSGSVFQCFTYYKSFSFESHSCVLKIFLIMSISKEEKKDYFCMENRLSRFLFNLRWLKKRKAEKKLDLFSIWYVNSVFGRKLFALYPKWCQR